MELRVWPAFVPATVTRFDAPSDVIEDDEFSSLSFFAAGREPAPENMSMRVACLLFDAFVTETSFDALLEGAVLELDATATVPGPASPAGSVAWEVGGASKSSKYTMLFFSAMLRYTGDLLGISL